MDDLYREGGEYWYTAGINPRALIALALGIAPCAPGFLATVGWLDAPAIWKELYHYAWFLSFGIAFVVYVALMAATRSSVAQAKSNGPAEELLDRPAP